MAAPFEANTGESNQALFLALLKIIEPVVPVSELKALHAEWMRKHDRALVDLVIEKGWLREQERIRLEELIRRYRNPSTEETYSTQADGGLRADPSCVEATLAGASLLDARGDSREGGALRPSVMWQSALRRPWFRIVNLPDPRVNQVLVRSTNGTG